MPEIIARPIPTRLRRICGSGGETAFRHRFLVGAAVACLAISAARGAEAQPAVAGDGAHHGYLAARLTDGGGLEVIDELNAGRFFVPASVLKAVTAAAALDHLGSGYRWRTRLTSAAEVADGVLDGDLVIEPGADPTWGRDRFPGGAAEPLAALAEQVRARGIARVTGDLVVDASRFPGRPHPLGSRLRRSAVPSWHPARRAPRRRGGRSRCGWHRAPRSARRPGWRRPTA